MPLTPPFPHQPPAKKLDDVELAKAIRLDLEAEMDAINLYTSHMDATDNTEAKKILAHVIKEEKDHAALFVELLKKLDPEQGKLFDEGEEYFDAALQDKEAMVKQASDFDIEAALKELKEKDEDQIEQETAYKWASRSIACFQMYNETKMLRCLLAAENYGHEAIEHAALVQDKGKTLKTIEAKLDKAREEIDYDTRLDKIAKLFDTTTIMPEDGGIPPFMDDEEDLMAALNTVDSYLADIKRWAWERKVKVEQHPEYAALKRTLDAILREFRKTNEEG